MKMTKDQIKAKLKEQWCMACEDYLAELLKMWGLDAHYGYWNSDDVGSIYHYGETHNLTMCDIIFCVDHDISEDVVLAWEDYILDASEFGLTIPNLPSWCRGCPRTPPEVFEKLRGMKADLENAVKEEKERIRNGERINF